MSLIPYKRNLEVEKKVLEELLRGTVPPLSPMGQVGGFSVSELGDCWRVGGVVCSDGVYQVDWAKVLLDNGVSKTQEEWGVYSCAAKITNGYGVASAPFHHAFLKALHAHKGDVQYTVLIEKIRVFLADTFKKFCVSTLSRVIYESIGQDKVVCDYGLPHSSFLDVGIVGPDELLRTSTKSQTACKALFGSDNLKSIQDVYHWVSGRDAYLWRVNSKPQARTERVVVLGVSNLDWFYLNAIDSVNYWPAFGVRVQKIL